MGKLSDLLKRLEAFDPNETLNETLDTAQAEQFIADQVRKRLKEKGEDATGRKLKTDRARGGNAYSDYTIALKQAMGREWRHVTLLDTGSFHKSLELKLANDFMQLVGDSDKEDGKIEENLSLTNVLNLSPEEKTNVVNEYRAKYVQKVRQAVKL